MSKKTLEENILKQFLAIDLCIEKGLLMPSLTLIYSGIDCLASLNRPQDKEKVTRRDFKAWCDNYLLPDSGLKCEAIDLYAARCSILHSYTAISELSINEKASELIYCIGNISDKLSTYQKIIDEKYPRKTIIINIEILNKAFKKSYFAFSKELDIKPDQMEIVLERAKYYFVDRPTI